MFSRYNTTPPVKSFVINQLTKDNTIMNYDGITLREIAKHLKKVFKHRMDKWILRKANWLDVAKAVKEYINELEEH